MAEQPKGETSAEPAAEKTAAPRPKSVMLIRITVLLFVVAVIGAECLVASLCIPTVSESNAAQAEPSADDSDAKAAPQHGATEHKPKSDHKKKPEEKTGGHKKHGTEKGEIASPGDPPDQVEIDLEQFSVTAHQPDSNTTMRIEFHLFGVISGADQEEFEKLLKANQHRFREQVLVTVRSAEATDLADAGLGLIKRQILEKTNALLGKPLLKAVIVSQFSYMEQ